MAGTANEFCDYNELNNIDLFSAWLFGKINANCILADLSRCGCSVLIPKKQSTPSGIFNLLIMAPDDDDRLHTVLKGEQVWGDSDYSSTHKRIGIKFSGLEPEQLLEINLLSQQFKSSKNASIKCSLLKR